MSEDVQEKNKKMLIKLSILAFGMLIFGGIFFLPGFCPALRAVVANDLVPCAGQVPRHWASHYAKAKKGNLARRSHSRMPNRNPCRCQCAWAAKRDYGGGQAILVRNRSNSNCPYGIVGLTRSAL